MKVRVRVRRSPASYPEGQETTSLPPIPEPLAKKRPEDYPPYIDPATGKFKKGHSGYPGGLAAQVRKRGIYIQSEILRFFEDRHLNTGELHRWIRSSPRNRVRFYSWVIKNMLPKEMKLYGSIDGDVTHSHVLGELSEKDLDDIMIGASRSANFMTAALSVTKKNGERVTKMTRVKAKRK